MVNMLQNAIDLRLRNALTSFFTCTIRLRCSLEKRSCDCAFPRLKPNPEASSMVVVNGFQTAPLTIRLQVVKTEALAVMAEASRLHRAISAADTEHVEK